VSDWKPAYLIHGDDHGRVSERRGNFRRTAERAADAGGVEVLEGEAATPQAAAAALSAMTFAMGHRFIVVDGVERWKDADVKEHLAPVLAAIAPDTTVAFFGRDEGRAKTPAALVKAVTAAGGQVAAEQALKAKELPRWCVAEAARLGVTLDLEGAASLVEHVGDRQQRLLRELEKLALEHGAGAHLGAEEVEAAAAPSSERQAWGLGDALIARDRRAAIRIYHELRAQGEPLARLIPLLSRRVREVEQVAARLEAGESPPQIKASIKGAPWMVDRRLREARNSDLAQLRAAVETLAALERSSRGLDEVSEDTAAIRALGRIAA
jgi:DNA polymerase-3 subunit delta